jgi:type IV pilus assembly protein PilX
MGQSLICSSAFPPRSAPDTAGCLTGHPDGKQRGVVLFIALIALVAMTLAAIALIRATDTSNIIAGNLAFKQATVQASDTGVEQAITALVNTIVPTSVEADIANLYFATQQPVDSYGVPTTINWASVPCRDTAGNTLGSCSDSSAYRIQYMIDRLCTGTLPITDIQGSCVTSVPSGGGSHRSGGVVFTSASKVYYRITVRVSGPRNATTMVQAMVGR